MELGTHVPIETESTYMLHVYIYFGNLLTLQTKVFSLLNTINLLKGFYQVDGTLIFQIRTFRKIFFFF